MRVTMVLMLVVWVVKSREVLEPVGENICTRQELETKQIKVSYLQSVRVKKHYVCVNIPPICAEWVNTMEKRWRLENITRTVTVNECCPGYQQEDQFCHPVCGGGCGGSNGFCSAPETCRCKSGFSGASCETMGCPQGRWGEGCKEDCSCQNGGYCDPVSGGCSCTPGFKGSLCQDRCLSGTFGAGCSSDCSCGNGTTCHHITGDCIPCQSGYYGESCSSTCICHPSGTDLCSPLDGKCYCEPNWFGANCGLECPFGYINNTCLLQPVRSVGDEIEACECPTDLYVCDPKLGCLCPQGVICGLEMNEKTVEVISLQSSAVKDQKASISSAAPVIVSVLILAVIAVVLVMIYYRRRMRVMKNDLANRTVYYTEREGSTGSGQHDLIIRDGPPLETETIRTVPGTTLLNNVRLHMDSQHMVQGIHMDSQHMAQGMHMDSQHMVQGACGGGERPVKNVNVDNFKLGASGNESEARIPDVNSDINVFNSDLKSNFYSQDKAVKADLEVMIRNDFAKKGGSEKLKNTNIKNDEEDDSICVKTKLNVCFPDK